MAPVVRALEKEPAFRPIVCVTGQHREMLDQVLDLFGIEPDLDLRLMSSKQTLNGFLSKAVDRLDEAYERFRPDRVLVHGDTTTAMAAALAAFHRGIAVDHVEAGLRTYSLDHPFPEEMNRRYIDVVSEHLFAPTAGSRRNLEEEKLRGKISVTGNTGIDALQWVHLNPNVSGPVEEALRGLSNVHLIAPLSYLPFVRLMQRADVILTDSGGVQEEAPSLGKPVLVMRDVTERPEAVAAGTAQLVGTNVDAIVGTVTELLRNPGTFWSRANPYGDGKASVRIASILAGRAMREFSWCEPARELNVA
jgi:UDP-N-acetylglucosamine 2-epimerase (non-hydrolysing)